MGITFACGENVLKNTKFENQKHLFESLLESFHLLVCNMTIKIYFLNSTLGECPANSGDTRDEHAERFHQDIKVMEER